MGTSKGYIAPTKPEWTQTKRAVTSMLRNPSTSSISKVVDKYATALQSENFTGSSFPAAVAGFIGLLDSIRSGGVEYALKEHGFESLIGKPSSEILNALLDHYSNGNGTLEDNLVIDCLSKIMEIFEIADLDDFNRVSNEELLKELIINYIQMKFEQIYEEKIRANRSPAEGTKILSDVKEYLRDHLIDTLTVSDLAAINFMQIDGQRFIIDTCREAYVLLRTYDEE